MNKHISVRQESLHNSPVSCPLPFPHPEQPQQYLLGFLIQYLTRKNYVCQILAVKKIKEGS